MKTFNFIKTYLFILILIPFVISCGSKELSKESSSLLPEWTQAAFYVNTSDIVDTYKSFVNKIYGNNIDDYSNFISVQLATETDIINAMDKITDIEDWQEIYDEDDWRDDNNDLRKWYNLIYETLEIDPFSDIHSILVSMYEPETDNEDAYGEYGYYDDEDEDDSNDEDIEEDHFRMIAFISADFNAELITDNLQDIIDEVFEESYYYGYYEEDEDANELKVTFDTDNKDNAVIITINNPYIDYDTRAYEPFGITQKADYSIALIEEKNMIIIATKDELMEAIDLANGEGKTLSKESPVYSTIEYVSGKGYSAWSAGDLNMVIDEFSGRKLALIDEENPSPEEKLMIGSLNYIKKCQSFAVGANLGNDIELFGILSLSDEETAENLANFLGIVPGLARFCINLMVDFIDEKRIDSMGMDFLEEPIMDAKPIISKLSDSIRTRNDDNFVIVNINISGSTISSSLGIMHDATESFLEENKYFACNNICNRLRGACGNYGYYSYGSNYEDFDEDEYNRLINGCYSDCRQIIREDEQDIWDITMNIRKDYHDLWDRINEAYDLDLEENIDECEEIKDIIDDYF